jgi:hypothetical protein
MTSFSYVKSGLSTHIVLESSTTIVLETDAGAMGQVSGEVDCGTPRDTTAQPSSSPMNGNITQDRDSRDGDGIPDSTDNCSHNSNPRCFKEATNSWFLW